MIIFIKKKLSFIIIGFFIFFSLQNLSQFNDFGMIDSEKADESNDSVDNNDLSVSDSKQF
mgnify:CR=1